MALMVAYIATQVTYYYIDSKWSLCNAITDFKVSHESTTGERIFADQQAVLTQYPGAQPMVVPSVTDTTGNTGKLGNYLRENGYGHEYCTDHNLHRKAIHAFDGK